MLVSRPFLLLVTAATLCAFAQYAALVNLVPLLTGRGLSPSLAAWALGLGGAGQVAGRLCYRQLAARLGTRGRTVAVIAAGAAVTLLLGLLPGPAALLVAASVLAGAVRGVFTLTEATLVADYWGADRYAAVNGVFNAPAGRRRGDRPQHRRGHRRRDRQLPGPVRHPRGRRRGGRGARGHRTVAAAPMTTQAKVKAFIPNEARREAPDSLVEVGQRRVEAVGVAGRHRVGDGPVHRGQPAELLAGQVAHGDDEVPVLADLVDVPGPQAAQRQVVASGGGDRARVDRGGRAGAGRGGGDLAGPAPQRRRQVRARRVGGAHEQHPPCRPRRRPGERVERARHQPQVGASAVAFGTAAA